MCIPVKPRRLTAHVDDWPRTLLDELDGDTRAAEVLITSQSDVSSPKNTTQLASILKKQHELIDSLYTMKKLR